MILYPAIDLKGGEAVRLVKGAMASATVFNRDPADQARRFAAAGFSWLHVVDLDGAFAGAPKNRPAVEAILAASDLPVQLGGGIRDLETIDSWLATGITRVILGTATVKTPLLVAEAAQAFPGAVAVGIDARGGKVALEGWAEASEIDALELAQRMEDSGVAAFIYTDIERDGTLSGANCEATARLAEAVSVPVIASGGVTSLEDLRRLKVLEPLGVTGAILGRALYDGRIDPAKALAVARPEGELA